MFFTPGSLSPYVEYEDAIFDAIYYRILYTQKP